MSLSLGQVDGMIVFALGIALWAWRRGSPVLTGMAIAVAAGFKIIPGLLLLYFLWKRAYRVLFGGMIAGAGLGILSLVVLGPANLMEYLRGVIPLLLKGSVHHQNVTIAAFFNRLFLDKAWLASLSEIPDHPVARGLTLGTSLAVIACVLYFTRGRAAVGARLDKEVGLALAAAIFLSSIAWEFYLTWLLPLLLLLIHPVNWPRAGARPAVYLGGLLVAVLAMSFPVGFLAEPNHLFYQPLLLPGAFLEFRLLHLYASVDHQVYCCVMAASLEWVRRPFTRSLPASAPASVGVEARSD
jgi:hypothetical protein